MILKMTINRKNAIPTREWYCRFSRDTGGYIIIAFNSYVNGPLILSPIIEINVKIRYTKFADKNKCLYYKPIRRSPDIYSN